MTHRQHGFTLIELLVSLAILALIAVALAGTFRYGRLSWQHTGELDADENLESVHTFIRQRLSTARQIDAISKDGRLQLAFKGQQQSVTFIALSQGYTEVSGLYQTAFILERNDGSGSGLFFVETLFRPDSLVDTVHHRRRLVENIDTVQLRYFGRPKPQSSRQWWQSWEGATLLPELVEITVSFPAEDKRHWNSLVVPINAAGS